MVSLSIVHVEFVILDLGSKLLMVANEDQVLDLFAIDIKSIKINRVGKTHKETFS